MSYVTLVLVTFGISFLINLLKISIDCANIEDRNIEIYCLLQQIYIHFDKNTKTNIGFVLKMNTLLSADRFFYRS